MNPEKIPTSSTNPEEDSIDPETLMPPSPAQQHLGERGLAYAIYVSPELDTTSLNATQETTGTKGRYSDNIINSGKYDY